MREGRNAGVEGSRQDRDRSRFGARHRSRHGGDRRRCRVVAGAGGRGGCPRSGPPGHMYRELARLPIEGVVVVGEGEENETPLLYIGETVGAGENSGLKVDLAVDPVEGSTLCAKALPNALSVLALAERGSLLKVPTIYMDKIAIGPDFPE